ncbi:MAG TPA: redoxin family protein [Gemmatales bacterium]|nr:redoxin family protein [Gemmatales bacterium]
MTTMLACLLMITPDAWPTASIEKLDGQSVSFRSAAGDRTTVVVFLSPECPVSNGYVPVLKKMSEEAFGKEVNWIVVYPEAISREKVATHAKEFQLPGTASRDASGDLARQLAVSMVPEVVVLTKEGKVVYRGRIDDRYTRRGGSAREPRQHDLKDVLLAVQAGKTPAKSYIQPVGCPLPTIEKEPAAQDKNGVSYTKHVAAILQDRCVGCHRTGGVGPFVLSDYESAKSWAPDVVAMTQSGQMPPWKAVSGHGEFDNDRRMNDADKKVLADWLAADCPRGDAKDLPVLKVYSDQWMHGKPDIVLQPSEKYTISASGEDDYRCFVLPTNFTEDKYIAGFEVMPGNKKVVHHVILFIDTSGYSEVLDAKDPGPGYSTVAGFPGFIPYGGLGGWAPGNTGRLMPEGTARLLPKGARIVMQVHYHKSGKTEVDQTQVGFYYAKGEVKRGIFDLLVLPVRTRFGGLNIPAGDNQYESKSSLTLADDYYFYSTTPHMHLIGRDMKVVATLPDGTEKPLIYVNDWDFNWQESYRYKEQIALPKGTRLDMVAHFDNSAKNANNPNDPPKKIVWGENTTDEMCIAFFEVSFQREAKTPEELKPPGPGFLIRQQLGAPMKK